MVNKKGKKKSIIDEFFGKSFFGDTETAFKEPPESRGFGGGYSINVVQTPEGTTVRAKAGKDTDVNMLKKQLQQRYPNAKIEIEGGKNEPLIREISTKSLKKKKQTD